MKFVDDDDDDDGACYNCPQLCYVEMSSYVELMFDTDIMLIK